MSTGRTIIDVSTVLRWKGKHAVGIVRTEREIAKYFLSSAENTKLVYFDRESQDFRNLSSAQISALFDDVAIRKTIDSESKPDVNSLFLFRDGDSLISAGLQWDIDFLGALYFQRKHCDIIVAQVVYDIIPVLMPEYCVPGMDTLFPKFIMDTTWTADYVYAISNSTLEDFKAYAGKLRTGRMPSVRRIALGCDIPTGSKPVEKYGDLEKNKYVLYVSTIEPRKNHKMLFDIWRSLEGRADLPRLVFVGGAGWNTENLMVSLENCVRLYPEKITILDNVSDDELEWLYTNAGFTVYPSLYEGWGLPIAESLARGTPCLASNTSSMPEVGGGFCDLLDPLDFASWRSVIASYLDNPEILADRRTFIQKNYKVYDWESAMIDFKKDFDSLRLR